MRRRLGPETTSCGWLGVVPVATAQCRHFINIRTGESFGKRAAWSWWSERSHGFYPDWPVPGNRWIWRVALSNSTWDSLSLILTRYWGWPIIIVACRHERIWINSECKASKLRRVYRKSVPTSLLRRSNVSIDKSIGWSFSLRVTRP